MRNRLPVGQSDVFFLKNSIFGRNFVDIFVDIYYEKE